MYTEELKVTKIEPRIIHRIEHTMIPEEFRDDVYDRAVEDYYNHIDSADGDFTWKVDLHNTCVNDPFDKWLNTVLDIDIIVKNKFGIRFSH